MNKAIIAVETYIGELREELRRAEASLAILKGREGTEEGPERERTGSVGEGSADKASGVPGDGKKGIIGEAKDVVDVAQEGWQSTWRGQ